VIGVLLLGAAVAVGVPMWRVLLLAAVIAMPLVVAMVVVIVVWRSRGSDDRRSTLFCEGVTSELRAGASLRQALSLAAVATGCPAPPTDSTLGAAAGELAGHYEAIRGELALTIDAAARSGGAAADIFEELGSLALARSEIRHEVRVATAPGRAAASVLVGAPVVFVLNRLASGEVRSLLASSQQRIVALFGLGLFLMGLLIACFVAWRA